MASLCTGFVAADLAALCREAALRARTTGGGGADVFSVRMADLLWAHAQAIPSTQRETVLRLDRTVSWDDIGGCAEAKQVGPSSASGGACGNGVGWGGVWVWGGRVGWRCRHAAGSWRLRSSCAVARFG